MIGENIGSISMKSGKDRKCNAIILAAGFGLRMVPINTDRPKALLSVNGEILIERLIRQLREVGVEDIFIVVGYMKEKLTYLKDKYSVTLVENLNYGDTNNLYSLSLVAEKISDSFILPCDIWCRKNLFSSNETESYYMVYANDMKDKELPMTGVAYITHEDAERFKQSLSTVIESDVKKTAFWEEVLYDSQSLWIKSRSVATDSIIQINTLEDLRKLDSKSEHLQSEEIDLICQTLQVHPETICEITALKKGMTNRSFLFSCEGQKYIMRIPGEGTELLINRQQEASVYQVLDNTDICDDVVYINPTSGYKITRFVDHARNCDVNDVFDLKKCMSKLREFHESEYQVEHEFNLFEQINFYETLLEDTKSVYSDYNQVKKQVFDLSDYIDKYTQKKVLSHIDAVPDNFLIYTENDEEVIRLIDWEYAGMQDPHVDIAMFCIYALYDRAQIDQLIDIYFEDACPKEIRLKIYCYIAVCGLLWSNWCEYKRSLGVDFGEYAYRQYQYARDFSSILTNR